MAPRVPPPRRPPSHVDESTDPAIAAMMAKTGRPAFKQGQQRLSVPPPAPPPCPVCRGPVAVLHARWEFRCMRKGCDWRLGYAAAVRMVEETDESTSAVSAGGASV